MWAETLIQGTAGSPPARESPNSTSQQSHGTKQRRQTTFSSSALLTLASSQTLVLPQANEKGVRRHGVESLAPAKRLAALQMLSYSIPASVKTENQTTLPRYPLLEKLLLAIHLNIKCPNSLHVSLLPVQAIGVVFLKGEILQRCQSVLWQDKETAAVTCCRRLYV